MTISWEKDTIFRDRSNAQVLQYPGEKDTICRDRSNAQVIQYPREKDTIFRDGSNLDPAKNLNPDPYPSYFKTI